MQPNTPIKSINESYYKFHSTANGLVSGSVQPKDFRDEISTQRFLRDLSLTPQRCLSLLHGYNAASPTSNSTNSLEQLATVLMRGRLRVYKVPKMDTVKRGASEPLKSANGDSFSLVAAASMLGESSASVMPMADEGAAKTFLTGIAKDEKQLRGLASALDIPEAETAKKDDLIQQLSKAVANGDVLLIKNPPAPAPQSGVVEESAANMAGNKPVSAPSSSSAAPAAAKANNTNADAQASQAEALVNAAEDGAAFCEECEA